MNVEAAVLSILVGLLRKGRISNLGRIPLRGTYVFAVPLVLCALAIVFTHHTDNSRAYLIGTRITNVLQYVVLLTAIGLNLHIRELRIVGAGAFMNFLALTVNGGVMPISESAARAAGLWALLDPAENTKLIRHVIMTPETRLRLLTDFIPIPVPYIRAVLSIGDVVLAIGIFVLIQRFMVKPSPGARLEKTN